MNEEKEKADRCLRIARRKYDKPSAYRSGAIVRCRQGKIWKGLSEADVNDAPDDVKDLIYKAHDAITRRKGKDYAPDVHELQAWIDNYMDQQDSNPMTMFKETVNPEEVYDNRDAIQTVADGKRDLAWVTVIGFKMTADEIYDMASENGLKVMGVQYNPNHAFIVYKPEAVAKATRLKDIAEKYDGLLSTYATKEDSIEIGKLLGYDEQSIQSYISKKYDENGKLVGEAKKTDFSKEKKSGLHGWFSRRGGGGSKGWVDCNTCRTVDGKKKCKACGRQKGEKRAKYPSCRPTPASCGTPGKGKSWGKTKESVEAQLNEELNRIKSIINY